MHLLIYSSVMSFMIEDVMNMNIILEWIRGRLLLKIRAMNKTTTLQEGTQGIPKNKLYSIQDQHTAYSLIKDFYIILIKKHCAITSNGGQILKNKKRTLMNYGKFWFSPQDIKNILSLGIVSDQYRVT